METKYDTIRKCLPSRLDPNVERRNEEITGTVHTCGCSIPTRVGLVDVMLHDSCPSHSGSARIESHRDLPDWGQANACASQSWIDEAITDRDEDDECKGIEVGQDVIGQTVRGHCGGLADLEWISGTEGRKRNDNVPNWSCTGCR